MKSTPQYPPDPPAAYGPTAPVSFVHNVKFTVQPTYPVSAAAIPLPGWKFVQRLGRATLQLGGYRHGLSLSTPIAANWGAATTSPPQDICQPSWQGCSHQLLQKTSEVYMYKTLQCSFYQHPFIRIYCNTKKIYILNPSPPPSLLRNFSSRVDSGCELC